MRFRYKTSWKTRSLCLLLAVAGCEDGTTSNESEDESDLVRRQSAIVTGTLTTDSLTTYAAKCDAATGIHVPWFDCTKGTETPQGSSIDNLEVNVPIGITGGSRTANGTVQTIVAGGDDGIAGTSDEFYFGYQFFTGLGSAEVKVTGLVNTSPTAKAGLMLRAGTAANASNFMIGINAGGNAVFQARVATGATTTATLIAGKTAPIWLRLIWDLDANVSGNWLMSGFISTDERATWTKVGNSISISIANFTGVPLIGLAATSRSTVTTTATFDKFSSTKVCDNPNVLNGRCDPRSKFQVLVQTADATVVANCRKGNKTEDNQFADIAVIQYNRKNGAICYYQSPPGAHVANNISSPSLGTGTGLFPWITPAATHFVGCTSCHDSGPFIRSPYIYQMGKLPSEADGYDNVNTKLRYVGIDFKDDKSWHVGGVVKDPADTGGVCNSCHRLGVNNVIGGNVGPGGTALNFAMLATASTQAGKNPHSLTSPIWMRPGTNIYNAPAEVTASKFANCANGWINDNFQPGSHTPAGCTFTLNGTAYERPIQFLNDQNIGASGGTATGSLEFQTLNTPANTDVFGTSDQFFWTYMTQFGDGAAVVKVTRLDNTNPYAKAGIMFRDGMGTNAVNVMLAITPSQGATFQYRAAAGATTNTAYLTGRTLPIWLRLVRSGRTFVGSVSSDGGNTWAQVGAPVTLPTLAVPYMGLVATSHNPTTPTRADFESFDWSNAWGWTGANDPHVLADANIGASSGARTELKTVETMSSSGGDIFGTSDQFLYSYKNIDGDGIAITKVTSQVANQGTIDPYAKAGLMVRDTADANAANVFVGKTPSGATFQSRPTAGAATTAVNVTAPALPVWFRMIRSGRTFIGSRSSDGISWTQIGDPVTFSSFNHQSLLGLAVSSHSTSTVTAKLESGVVPEPPGFQWTYGVPSWLDANIGITGGSRTTSMGNEIITAAGADIYGTSDQFFYTFRSVIGAATIYAKVNGFSGTNIDPYAKAGVMFRDAGSPGSPNAMMTMTFSQGASFQYRTTNGGTTPTPTFRAGNAPRYLKLVRSATNVFTGYVSQDGIAWGTPVGSTTLNNIGPTALVGLAVTSHNASQPVTATFTNITITTP